MFEDIERDFKNIDSAQTHLRARIFIQILEDLT